MQWPTATSNPKPPVAAHGRSWMTARPLDQNPEGFARSRGNVTLHLQSVSEDPPPRQAALRAAPRGGPGVSPARFWLLFPRGKSNRRSGLRKPGLSIRYNYPLPPKAAKKELP